MDKKAMAAIVLAVALAGAAGAWLGKATPATVADSWTLIVEHSDGNRYAVDYGMTQSDCMARARGWIAAHPTHPVVECDDESYRAE